MQSSGRSPMVVVTQPLPAQAEISEICHWFYWIWFGQDNRRIE
jgi:hypothetical protein